MIHANRFVVCKRCTRLDGKAQRCYSYDCPTKIGTVYYTHVPKLRVFRVVPTSPRTHRARDAETRNEGVQCSGPPVDQGVQVGSRLVFARFATFELA